ncbi:MAG: hypothetical protein H7287_01735 [Thermoleophilia bacterium]|nr:hypothetical protein [Thermoleophilia bacterium]
MIVSAAAIPHSPAVPRTPPRSYPGGGHPYPSPYPTPYNTAPYPIPYPNPQYPVPSNHAPSPSYPAPGPSYPAPTVPGSGGTSAVRSDVTRSLSSLQESLNILGSIPVDDRGSESTKQARLSAFHSNRAAQDLLEGHFNDRDQQLTSTLHAADASLEDAAWQMARKSSPDGRFNGVDIRGAIEATQAAVALLNQVLGGR